MSIPGVTILGGYHDEADYFWIRLKTGFQEEEFSALLNVYVRSNKKKMPLWKIVRDTTRMCQNMLDEKRIAAIVLEADILRIFEPVCRPALAGSSHVPMPAMAFADARLIKPMKLVL